MTAAGGPGNYAHYQWPTLPAGTYATAVEMDHVWVVLPTAKDTNGNAVFASTQQWYGPSSVGAYMGTQAWLQENGTMAYRALFSVWDASPMVQTSWLPGPGYCERFGGEGTGAHCIIAVQLVQGLTYRVRVEYIGRAQNASGAWGAAWRGTFTDVAANASVAIGTLFHPDMAPGVNGYGNLTIVAADFQEYFLSSACTAQAVAGIGLTGPRFTLTTGAVVTPVHASADYVADCAFSDVTGCIPSSDNSGAAPMCGPPHVYMLGGGATNRTNMPGAQLW